MKRLSAFARSTLGRLLLAALGFGCLALLVHRSDPRAVLGAVVHAPLLFPAVVLLQALVVALESWALLLLYGPARFLIPRREVWRSSMFSFSMVVVFPFGRAVGEAARAAMLSRYVGSPLAAAAATQIQTVTLLGNSLISIPSALAIYLLVGPGWLLFAVLVHFAVSGALAAALALASRYAGLAKKLGRLFPGGEEWGSKVDDQLKVKGNLLGPLALVLLSRAADTVQRMVLLAAVGGSYGLLHGLTSEGINLTAASLGDAIPGQVGITEMGYSLTASALSLSNSDAVAMGLLAHLAVLVWVGLGFLVVVVSRAPEPLPVQAAQAEQQTP